MHLFWRPVTSRLRAFVWGGRTLAFFGDAKKLREPPERLRIRVLDRSNLL
jgi:hypothetical protein